MTRFLYHVLRDGRRLTTWGGGSAAAHPVSSTPSFSAEVDGSIGPLAIELPRSFGDTGDDLALGNVIQTDAIDEAGAVTRIHEGTIERIEEVARAGAQSVAITVQPYVASLALDHFRDDAAGTTVARSWTSTDVATILTAILDRYIQRQGSFARIRTSATSVQASGSSISIQVGSETYLSALQRVKKLGPGNFFWYVQPDGLFLYRAYDAGTHHRLTLGRDVLEVRRTRDLTDVRNTVYFWNQSDADGTVVAFERPSTATTSQTTYGRRVQVVTDSRIDSEATAEAVTEAFIAEHEAPVTTLQVDVLARATDPRGYRIEALTPGDTVEIVNLPALASTVYSILRVDYRGTSASLTIGVGPARRPKTLGMAIEEMATFMRTSTDGSIPTTLTA